MNFHFLLTYSWFSNIICHWLILIHLNFHLYLHNISFWPVFFKLFTLFRCYLYFDSVSTDFTLRKVFRKRSCTYSYLSSQSGIKPNLVVIFYNYLLCRNAYTSNFQKYWRKIRDRSMNITCTSYWIDPFCFRYFFFIRSYRVYNPKLYAYNFYYYWNNKLLWHMLHQDR